MTCINKIWIKMVSKHVSVCLYSLLKFHLMIKKDKAHLSE